MHIIKLSATDSTNTYLKKLSTKEKINDYTCVIAEHQTKGRGQMGTTWNSEPGKNLVFSVFKDLEEYKIDFPFFISIIVTLSIFETLKSKNIPDLSIKWPNDIMSVNKKICGILIENVVKKNIFRSSIIGVGLNANQTDFNNLPNASSLKMITGEDFNLEALFTSILNNLKTNFLKFNENNEIDLKKKYEAKLFKRNKSATFINSKGTLFQGKIKGINELGKLIILLEKGILKEFDLKEITLLY